MTTDATLPENSSFSRVVPGLQIAWDSTSLMSLKTCPRKYQYEIVEGWTSRHTNVHLAFGIWMHEGKEKYDRGRANGMGHDAAVESVVDYILRATWDSERGRPWCSDDPNKNRLTLVRSLVWYFEEYRDDPIETIVFADGKPAVELSFSFETDFYTEGTDMREELGDNLYDNRVDRERYVLCGHIDRLGRFQDRPVPCDIKTSKHGVDERFFSGFTPGNQFSLYLLATQVFYRMPARGLICDAMQVAVTFTRFARQEIARSAEQLAEWYSDFGQWVRTAERYARAGHWPQNESACGNFGGCPFRRVCSHGPSVRDQWLRADFIRRLWDPLRTRGDI